MPLSELPFEVAQEAQRTLDLGACGLLQLRLLRFGLRDGRLGLTNEPRGDPKQTTIRLLDGLLGSVAAQTKSLSDLAHAP